MLFKTALGITKELKNKAVLNMYSYSYSLSQDKVSPSCN